MRAHITLSPKQLGLAMLFVALGGAVGTLIRDLLLKVNLYGIPRSSAVYSTPDWTHQIPWVLLAINTIGVYVATDLLRHRLNLAPHHRRVSFSGRRSHSERPFCGHARFRSTSAPSMTLLLVSIAGGVGCVVRYLFEYVVRRNHPTSRPWATVAANALGTGIAGYAAYRLLPIGDANIRAITLTGFCGGLTTFSSALAVPVILQREHHWGYAAALITTTPLVCSGMFVLGMSLAH